MNIFNLVHFEFLPGLLGLIGIPILILVYIIKSKYTEQTIASTYLWELSERFLKKKKRVSRLSGIISLILQLLAVTIISLAIAHPVITIPNAANRYCFILDGSASMRMEAGSGNVTRFEAAKQEIAQIVDGAVDGSQFKVICVGDTTSSFEWRKEKDDVHLILSELEPSYETADMTAAMGEAQQLFSEDPSILTYFITDAAYESQEVIKVINVGKTVDNYAVSDIGYTYKNSELTVVGKVISYENDVTLTVGLFMDGSQQAAMTESVSVKKGEPTAFTLKAMAETYASATVRILESDSLEEDNTYVIYNVESESSYDTLIVSDYPFFLQSILRNLIDAKIDVLKPSEYHGQTGYGLYVFDNVDANELTLPTDGTIWLVNIHGSVKGSGFTVQGNVELEKAQTLTVTDSTSSAAQALIAGLDNNEIFIKRYIKCGFYRNFNTIFSYKGNPVIFAGTNDNGNREVVFAMNLQDSNMPLLFDYLVLMRNLVKYSFPNMVERTDYECGTEALVNIIANCESIRVETPSGGISYLDTNAATDVIDMKEVGTYTVDMKVAGTTRRFFIWSYLNSQERVPTQTQEQISLQGEPTDGGFDGEYDPLVVMFIVLAVIFLADWMVYCYEKYQLR